MIEIAMRNDDGVEFRAVRVEAARGNFIPSRRTINN
jgi:hypothetical protein